MGFWMRADGGLLSLGRDVLLVHRRRRSVGVCPKVHCEKLARGSFQVRRRRCRRWERGRGPGLSDQPGGGNRGSLEPAAHAHPAGYVLFRTFFYVLLFCLALRLFFNVS